MTSAVTKNVIAIAIASTVAVENSSPSVKHIHT